MGCIWSERRQWSSSKSEIWTIANYSCWETWWKAIPWIPGKWYKNHPEGLKGEVLCQTFIPYCVQPLHKPRVGCWYFFSTSGSLHVGCNHQNNAGMGIEQTTLYRAIAATHPSLIRLCDVPFLRMGRHSLNLTSKHRSYKRTSQQQQEQISMDEQRAWTQY